MTDLSLVWDPENYRADMTVTGGDLATDAGLHTALIISLMTDRLADPHDFIPDRPRTAAGGGAICPCPVRTTAGAGLHWLPALAAGTGKAAAGDGAPGGILRSRGAAVDAGR